MKQQHLTIVTVIAAILGCAVTAILMAVTSHPLDMAIYREGARAFLDSRPLYSVPMMSGDIALPFIYPPFGALALSPFAASWLSDRAAGYIMIVLSAALLYACLWYVLRAVTGSRFSIRERLALTAVAWAVGVLMEPFRLNSTFAQVNVVIMALVIFDLVPRKRWLPQGTLIGIAAAIKITPLAMLLFFLLQRRWRPIVTAGLAGLAATVLAALVRWDATREYFSVTLLNMGTKSQIGVDTTYQSNSSLKGAIMRAFPSGDSLAARSLEANLIWVVLSLATIGLGGWLMVSLMRRRMLVDAALVNAVIMLLISPVSWSHHWVWLTVILPVVTWRCATVLHWPGPLTAILALMAAAVITIAPKWWFGDTIAVHELAFWQKFLVNDYVWMSLVLLAFWALALRSIPPLSEGIDSGAEPPHRGNENKSDNGEDP